MRFVVAFLALLGTAGIGAFAGLWVTALLDRELTVPVQNTMAGLGLSIAELMPPFEEREAWKTAVFLLAGTFLALLATVLVLFRRGLHAAMLLLLAVLGPALLTPATLPAMAPLVLVALLAAFVRPRREAGVEPASQAAA